MMLRLAELVIFLSLVVWTVVFPLATLLALGLTLPLLLLIGTRIIERRPARWRTLRTLGSRLAGWVAA